MDFKKFLWVFNLTPVLGVRLKLGSKCFAINLSSYAGLD